MMARQYDEILRAMSRNRAAFAQRVVEVRGDKRLTGDGKRELITEAFAAAMRKHNGLKVELAQAREAELAAARARAFAPRDGSPAGEVSYREALAQAREASSDGRKVEALLGQAVATRDFTLLRALAFIGHQSDNQALLESVAPYDGAVANLLEIEAKLGDGQGPDVRLARSMATTAPDRPREVSQMAVNAAMGR